MGFSTCLWFFREESGIDTKSGKSNGRNHSKNNNGDGGTDELNVILEWYSTLNHQKQLCWVFDKRPSQINGFIWEITWEDVKISTDLKLGEACATTGEVKKSLIGIVDNTLSALFGKKGKASSTSGDTETVHTAADFRRAFDEMGM